MTEFEGFVVTMLYLCIAFLALFAVAAIVDWATIRSAEREERRPRIPADERRLLGDDWRDRAGRWSRR